MDRYVSCICTISYIRQLKGYSEYGYSLRLVDESKAASTWEFVNYGWNESWLELAGLEDELFEI